MQSSRYKKAVHYLVIHWQSGRSLKSVAVDFLVDAGNLERAFRRVHGMTVKEYVNRKRREYTLKKLKDGGVYGYEIGSELGFGSDLTFYRWVKREFGMPLGALRRQLQSLAADEGSASAG